MKTIRTLEEMPRALSYLIEKVEGLEKTAQSLLNRQGESNLPHWMDVDELCNYIPSHPVKQTVYGWVSDKQIPHHKINKALVFLQSEIDDWMKHCGNKSIESKENIHKNHEQYEKESSTSNPHPPGLDRNNQVSFPRTNWSVYHSDVGLCQHGERA